MNKQRLDGSASAAPSPTLAEAPLDLAFLAGLAHELRTPLSAISGYAELLTLGMQGAVTPAQLDGLRRIQRNQKIMVRMIASTLNYVGASTGTIEFPPATASLADIISMARESLDDRLREREQTLEFTQRGDGAAMNEAALRGIDVRGDVERCAELFAALLTDAVETAPANSRIRVVVETDSHLDSGPVRPDGALVTVRISSDAPPVPDDARELMFVPFDRIGKSARAALSLDLPVARVYARAMGGDVTAIAGPARTIQLRLPLAS